MQRGHTCPPKPASPIKQSVRSQSHLIGTTTGILSAIILTKEVRYERYHGKPSGAYAIDVTIIQSIE